MARVHLGSDHAGLELKTKIAAHLRELGHEPVDHGPQAFDPEDDYPTYCLRAAEGVVNDAAPGALAIVIGGSGNGEAIAANKVKGTRCALAHSDETARLARADNDANVMSLGARMITEADALRFVTIFMATPFSGEARHARRIAQLGDYEKTGKLPEIRRAP
jgi:ribose 5-phosphate isomerase B